MKIQKIYQFNILCDPLDVQHKKMKNTCHRKCGNKRKKKPKCGMRENKLTFPKCTSLAGGNLKLNRG